MKNLLLPLLLICIFSCKNDAPINDTVVENNTDTISSDTIPVEKTVTEEIESKYHYDQDWEIFKTAVLTKDIKGMAAFASSDEIDSEALLQILSEELILKKLNSTTYDDLTTETQGEFIFLVFSVELSESDEEGNEYESGVYLYFTQGETSLLLDYYRTAG